MKRLFSIVIVAIVLASCGGKTKKAEGVSTNDVSNSNSADGKSNANGIAEINFAEPEYNFNEVKRGEEVQHVFKFTNTGDAPLIITNATGSCGCTVPKKPEDPVAPGEEGEIHVKVNTSKKKGMVNVSVRVESNAKNSTQTLKITGKVLVEEE